MKQDRYANVRLSLYNVVLLVLVRHISFSYLVSVWSGLCGLILKPFFDKHGCTAHLPLISIMCQWAHKITKATFLSASPFCTADVELAGHFKPETLWNCANGGVVSYCRYDLCLSSLFLSFYFSRATSNNKVREQVGLELSYVNSDLQLLMEQLEGLNSSVEVYQNVQ